MVTRAHDFTGFGTPDSAPANASSDSVLATMRAFARRVRARAALAFAVFVTFTAGAILLAYGLPSVYRSSATILIEQQELPRELVRSTITGFAEQRIREIEQRTMISTNLRGIMDRYGLYADERDDQPIELLVRRMRGDIDVAMISADVVDPQSGRPTEATIAFRLSFDSPSPSLAQGVTSELTTLFLGENLRRRSELAEDATRFLGAETAKLEARLAEIEARIGTFKLRNLGRLPEDTAGNVQSLTSADAAVRTAERDVTVLSQQLAFLREQLASDSGGGLQQRLRDLEAAQAAFTARYAPEHPTLLTAQREIAALRARLSGPTPAADAGDALRIAGELEARRRELGPVHPEVRALERELAAARADAGGASDPLTSELRRQVAQTQALLTAARATRDAASAQVAQTTARVSATPEIEGEYRALLRDHDQTRRKLEELRDRQLEADVSRALEAEQKGERFTLIEPAELPQTPIKPNRALLLFAGLVFAALATLASVALREAFDDSVRDARDLATSLGVVALVSLPHARNAEDLQRASALRRRMWFSAAAAALALIALFLAMQAGFTPGWLLARLSS